MHDDPERLIRTQLSCPTDNEFLCILVEISFAKRKRIERVKELGDIVDPDLDRIFGCRRWLMHLRLNSGRPPRRCASAGRPHCGRPDTRRPARARRWPNGASAVRVPQFRRSMDRRPGRTRSPCPAGSKTFGKVDWRQCGPRRLARPLILGRALDPKPAGAAFGWMRRERKASCPPRTCGSNAHPELLPE